LNLGEAVNAIRDKLVPHRLPGGKTLWATILKQIAERDSFDGQYTDTILAVIRSLLKTLDEQRIISLWRQTEAGMGDDTADECLFPDCCRMDVEMELLQQITSLACEEAKDARK
jgi:hypothetical protein